MFEFFGGMNTRLVKTNSRTSTKSPQLRDPEQTFVQLHKKRTPVRTGVPHKKSYKMVEPFIDLLRFAGLLAPDVVRRSVGLAALLHEGI